MRLGQLARKLALSPAEIVEFLAENHIQIDKESNTRLDDNHVALMMQRFALPVPAEISPGATVQENEEPREEPTLADAVANANDPQAAEIIESTDAHIENIDAAELPVEEGKPTEEKIEVIKAPKVELSGLKVLGKIDLPEPKKKEAPKDPAPVVVETPPDGPVAADTEKEPRHDRRRTNYPKNERRNQRPVKNPVALAREREAREAEEKKRAEAQREKERRTRHYFEKVKISAPTKAAKLVKEDVMQMSAADLAESPKTLWGKFLRWLTT